MSGTITTIPKFQFSSSTGAPLAGGKLYTYLAGTTTNATTYQDKTMLSANTNPIVLDSRGECLIWLDPQYEYKFVLKNSADVTQWTVDNVKGAEPAGLTAALSASSGSSLVGFIASGADADARTVQAKLRDTVSVKDFGAVGDGVTDDAAAFQDAVDVSESVYIPPGTYAIGSTVTIPDNITLFGAGYAASVIKRKTDSSFVIFDIPVTSLGGTFRDFKILESSTAYTNTSPFIQFQSNDQRFDNIWFYAGWQHISLLAGSSNVVIAGCVFESARKGAIISSSSVRNSVIGNCFWKNSADYSNPSDRGYAMYLKKEGAYTFGSSNWDIVGNYFAENVYGPFILSNSSEGIQIVGNFFEIPSQVDNGVKSDIELTNDSYVSISGNTSNSIVNSYAAGQRGAKYCVDMSGGGCSHVSIVGNTFEAGVSGTINDSSSVSVRAGNSYSDSTNDYAKFAAFSSNSGVASSNILTGYEEGTWTPVLNFGGAHVGQTYSVQSGSYTRIGRIVHLTCTLAISSKGSSTGAASIGGLPYVTGAGPKTSAYIIETDGGITLTGQLMLFNGSSSSALSLYAQNNGSISVLSDTAFSTPTIRFCIAYEM